jgi:PAS domain S-box-containing protein
VLSVTRDITERRQAERRLRASETRFSTIFRASPIGICITTLEDGKYLDANEAFCTLMGQRREDLIGRTSIELGHWINSESRKRLIEEIKRNTSQRNSEEKFCRTDGSIGYSHRYRERLTLDGQDCILTLVSDITESRRANADLQVSRQSLESLSHQLISAQETERRHLARELHDELGQVLTAMKIQLWSTQQTADAAMRSRLDESLSMIDRAINQVRNLSLDLRPPQLDDLGLVAALHWYLKKQAELAGFEQHFTTDPPDIVVSTDLATTCFRITQEAITNAIRHATPSEIFVELFRRDAELHLTIRDNGRGFDVTEADLRSSRGDSLGVSGMRERANLALGHLEVDSTPGAGTTIHAWFPLN